jgi:hypothetical protein
MLDDRAITPSSTELIGEGVWDSVSNAAGWSALLGHAAGGQAELRLAGWRPGSTRSCHTRRCRAKPAVTRQLAAARARGMRVTVVTCAWP